MNIFPGAGWPNNLAQPAPFKSNPETVANTNALNLRNEQFVIGQENKDRRIAERVVRQDARQLTRQQQLANDAQNSNVDFQTIKRPEASTVTGNGGGGGAATTSSANTSAPKRRSNRNMRRGRGRR